MDQISIQNNLLSIKSCIAESTALKESGFFTIMDNGMEM